MTKATVNADARMSPLRSIKLVAWSFLGIRSKSAYQEDLSKVNPIHVLVVALVGVLLLIAGLISLVNWVVAT
jgi:hypothetical protein|nr:DUF2970 domain-containing protein [uncultured Rhodoferax sp.]